VGADGGAAFLNSGFADGSDALASLAMAAFHAETECQTTYCLWRRPAKARILKPQMNADGRKWT